MRAVFLSCWGLDTPVQAPAVAALSDGPPLTRLPFPPQDNRVAHLVPEIMRNTQRYIKLFSQAIDNNLPEPSVDISDRADILDVIQFQRKEKNAQNEELGDVVFPPNLLRR